MTRAWSEPQRICFARLWRAGVSVPHIAVAFGVTPGSVSRMACTLRRRGHDLPRRGVRPAWTPERLARVADAVRAGADRDGLAAAMGVAPQSVSSTLSALRRAGHDVGAAP